MDTTEELIRRLVALKKALSDPNIWSLKPLVKRCDEMRPTPVKQGDPRYPRALEAQQTLDQMAARVKAKEAR